MEPPLFGLSACDARFLRISVIKPTVNYNLLFGELPIHIFYFPGLKGNIDEKKIVNQRLNAERRAAVAVCNPYESKANRPRSSLL